MEAQQKRLMEAFRTDCQTLMTRFELSYNTHFQNFCEIWRDMQFSSVFIYYPSEVGLTTFCEDALGTAKQFLVNASGLKDRIGALYLIYAIYYKMPVNQLKIRMTLLDWKCLVNLHREIRTEEYLDANYILCKLIVDNAFVQCVSDSMYGIERHFHEKQAKPTLDFSLVSEIKELAAPGKLLSTISRLSKLYEEQKQILLGDETSSVQLYNASVADDITKDIRTAQSESRLFAKVAQEEEAGCSKQSKSGLNRNSSQKIQKRMRLRKSVILSKIGRAFEKGLQSESSESEVDDPNSQTDSLQDA